MKINSIIINKNDNVAVVTGAVAAGETVTAASGVELVAGNDVPRHHKVATADIAAGDGIVKYGERIGVATKPIRKGDHVHDHNMKAEEN